MSRRKKKTFYRTEKSFFFITLLFTILNYVKCSNARVICIANKRLFISIEYETRKILTLWHMGDFNDPFHPPPPILITHVIKVIKQFLYKHIVCFSFEGAISMKKPPPPSALKGKRLPKYPVWFTILANKIILNLGL